jgi:hypothetical protein
MPSAVVGQLAEAREALKRAAAEKPEHSWTAEELRSAAAGRFPSTVVMVALDELIQGDELLLDSRLRIRYAG